MDERLKKVVGYIRGLFLRRKLKIKGFVCSIGRTKIYKHNGHIIVGNRTCLWPGVKLVSISNDASVPAILTVGNGCSIGDRTQIHCGKEVTIGDKVIISWDVDIIEYDYHAFGGGLPEPKPIRIEDEVWIACHVIITKGVTIGKGSTIGAGSVVTKDIPSYSFAAGNPAKPIKRAKSWCSNSIDESN